MPPAGGNPKRCAPGNVVGGRTVRIMSVGMNAAGCFDEGDVDEVISEDVVVDVDTVRGRCITHRILSVEFVLHFYKTQKSGKNVWSRSRERKTNSVTSSTNDRDGHLKVNKRVPRACLKARAA